MAIQFGVASVGGTFGYIQNFTKTDSADRAYAQDENGDTAAANTYNEKVEVKFEYIFDGTAPTVGSTITINTVKYTVISVEMVESNTEYKKLNVTAEMFSTNTVPSA